MEGLNRVTLVGNLGAEPELRHTQSGQAVLNLRLAVSESWFDKERGERKERTEWVTVVLWGKRGEALAKILAKGSSVLIEGRLQTRSWEQDGQKRYSTEVVATNVLLVGGRRDSQGATREQTTHERAEASGYSPDPEATAPFDGDDVPF